MISIVKLVDGTEIIGNVSSKEEGIFIEEPIQITYKIRVDSNVPVISMIRFIPFASEHKVTIKNEHVMAVASPMKGLIEYYNSTIKSLKDTQTDKAINDEFLSAAGSEAEELTEDMQIKLAMLEKNVLKSPLN